VRSITTHLGAGDLEDEGVEGRQYFLLDSGDMGEQRQMGSGLVGTVMIGETMV
jgi:hypothetical protein